MSDILQEILPGERTAEQALEAAKCFADPIYFCNTYCKAIVLDKGLTNIKLFPYQETMIKLAVSERFVIAKLPRQSGKTQCIAFFMCWLILFNPEYKIAIVAQKEKQAMDILKRVKIAYENLPNWLRIGVKIWNEKSIELETMASITVSGTTAASARGTSVNLLYLDEFAFVPQHIQDEFYTSSFPTISSGTTTKVMITSTPNGLDLFYKIWADSEMGDNDFKRVAIEWDEVPGRDAEWKRKMVRQLGSEEKFNQEFNAEFLGNSTTLIDGKKLRVMTFVNPSIKHEGMSIYKKPKKDAQYVIVADVAHGINQDYSAAVVFDVSKSPYAIVAKFQNNKIEPILFAQKLVQIAKEYNEAFVLVEVNDAGQQVVDMIYNDYEYMNCFGNNSRTQAKTPQLVLPNAVDAKLGIRTSVHTKKVGCANLKQLIENDRLIVQDFDIFKQLTRFTLHNNTYKAEDGNDDLVMCLVLFGWMADQKFFKEWSLTNFRLDLIKGSRTTSEAQLANFGFINDYVDIPEIAPSGAEVTTITQFEQWLNDDWGDKTKQEDAELDRLYNWDIEQARTRMEKRYLK